MGAAASDWRSCIVTDPQYSTHAKWGQLLRYALVGIATNLVGYGIYLLLTTFVLPPKATMTILYTTGAVLGFIGNRQFTFGHKGKLSRAALRYTVVHLLGWAMNYTLLYVLSDQLGYPHQLVQAIAVIVIAGYLFFVLRHFVFSTHLNQNGPPA